MIKVGTLCYVNSRAVGLMHDGRHVDGVVPARGDVVTILSRPLALANGETGYQITPPRSLVGTALYYQAAEVVLTPISDPDQTQDERHDERLTA